MRQGTVVGDEGQKMLVVPVGKKGPGLGRNDLVEQEFVKSGGPSFGALAMGSLSVLFFHAGSLAIGAPVIFIFRPFRMMSECVANFLARNAHPEKGIAHADDPASANLKGCLSLFASWVQQVFGKYSKTAYAELVLSGGGEGGSDGFFACADAAFDFLVKAGGSIAHLHGAMVLYELFGGACITLFCGWMSLILQDKLDMFSDQTSPYYIEDKNSSAIACMIVAFAVSVAWMSMWNQTADVLLYCVAWNRLQLHLGEEHNLEEADMIKEVSEFCPQTIRYLLPAHEMEAAHEHGLHAHGLGQQGAILAAMEHGAMDAHGGGGPDYSKNVASTYVTATRIVNG